MRVRYTVHSCSPERVPVTAQLPNGTPVEAEVMGLVIELVSDDARSTITPRYIPDDINADIAAFEVGRAFFLTLEPEKA